MREITNIGNRRSESYVLRTEFDYEEYGFQEEEQQKEQQQPPIVFHGSIPDELRQYHLNNLGFCEL